MVLVLRTRCPGPCPSRACWAMAVRPTAVLTQCSLQTPPPASWSLQTWEDEVTRLLPNGVTDTHTHSRQHPSLQHIMPEAPKCPKMAEDTVPGGSDYPSSITSYSWIEGGQPEQRGLQPGSEDITCPSLVLQLKEADNKNNGNNNGLSEEMDISQDMDSVLGDVQNAELGSGRGEYQDLDTVMQSNSVPQTPVAALSGAECWGVESAVEPHRATEPLAEPHGGQGVITEGK